METEVESVAPRIGFFIEVAKVCPPLFFASTFLLLTLQILHSIKNYSGLMTILNVLQSGHITKLKASFAVPLLVLVSLSILIARLSKPKMPSCTRNLSACAK